jgi:hypothetical protein
MKMQITHGLVTRAIREDLIINEILVANDFTHHAKRLCTKNVLGRAKERGQARLSDLQTLGLARLLSR